ncbi:MAG TPA: hypothetical protein VFD05_03635 [Bacilli bacterium]|nr:hypothetical protein [Bacilli bacterium]
MMIKRLFYKVFSIILLIGGLTFIVLGLIELFRVDSHNSTLYSLIAAPLMFLGVFLFTLGFGKEKDAKK